ncbi:MAG: FKBP-type peptidyl-prolyl cis-trans isomerase [Methanoculleus sp.]|nr:FKBP-type peptidyl-prolyl cis-trans isomerase [Methanoculleus sp.]
MAVQEGDFVRIRYTGRIGGDVFDTTDEEIAKEEDIYNQMAEYGPVTIRLGSRHILAGLEEELIGKEVGTEGEVEIPPEKAFGEHDENEVRSFPVTQFREKPEPGMRVSIEGREGMVISVIGRRAVVDFNHPLAGKSVHYTYSIVEKVEDQAEQIRGLIRIFARRSDIDIRITDGTVELELPHDIIYDRRWMMWRGNLVSEIFKYYPDINDIVMKETFTRPSSPELEPEMEETEMEESGESEE